MYPKQIELNDDKLKTLLEKKGVLITEGRAKSERIEEVEKEMQEIDAKLVEAEKEVDISDIDANAQDITDRFNALKAEMDAVASLKRVMAEDRELKKKGSRATTSKYLPLLITAFEQ